MKQHIVVKVQMTCDKCRSKALIVATSINGVSEVKLEGEEKDQIAVKGENIDSVKLTRNLKKKFGYANIVSIAVIEESAAAKDEEKKVDEPEGKETSYGTITPQYSNPYSWHPFPHFVVFS